MADWLRELKQQLPENRHFFEEMHRQLAPSFTAEVGEPLDDFVLVTPHAGLMVRHEGGRRVLDADLLNIDFLSRVAIAWTREGGALHFSWEHLDAGDIRAWLAMRRRIAIQIKRPVATEIRNPVWPHVTLTFETQGGVAVPEVEQAVRDALAGWNPAGGAIHNAGPVSQVGERTFFLTIDFGTAGVDALNHLLDALVDGLPITKLILDSTRPGT